MKKYFILFLLLIFSACSSQEKQNEDREVTKDSIVLEEPEGFKSTHQRDKEDFQKDSTRKFETERVRFKKK